MKTLRKSPSYLIRNPYSYCFRMSVPQDLQRLVGKKELRYSLKTGYLGVARHKARVLAGQVQQIFTCLRKGGTGLSGLSDAEIKELIEQHIKEYIEGLENRYHDDEPPFIDSRDFYSYLDTLDFIKEDIILYLGIGDYSTVHGIVAGLLEKNEIKGVEKGSAEHIRLCRELLRAQLKGLEIEKKHLLGNFSYADQPATSPTQLPAKTDKQRSERLSKVIEDYWSENMKAGIWKERTKVEYENALKVLLHFTGDVQIHTIDYDSMRAYKQLLQKLPKFFRTSSKYKDRPFKEILEIQEKQKDQTLSTSTVNKYLGVATDLFTYAVKNNHIPVNPASGSMIKQKKRVDELRDVFTKEDLKKLFHAKEYTEDSHKHPHNFWLPILGLYTGCRLEELCQLYCEDLKEVQGVWVLDINEATPDKSIKMGEKRLVPLHPFISKELNFPGFVMGIGQGRVFPELKRINNRYGHSVSRWFSKYRDRCGIEAEVKSKVFHSFRHTFIDTLKQSLISDNLIAEIVGHSIKGETMGRYGKRFKPKVLYENAILKLDFGIDLSHLKNSKYVIKNTGTNPV